MKITRRQLRKIIRESLREGLGDNEIAKDFIDGVGKWPGIDDSLGKESQLTWNTKDAGATEYSIKATDDIPKIKAFWESMFKHGGQPSGWMKKALDKYNAEGPYSDTGKLTATITSQKAKHDDEKTIIITFHEEKE